MIDTAREYYLFAKGYWMQRDTAHPFRWVLRDSSGIEVGRDQYRHDLMPRHQLRIVKHHDPSALAAAAREGGDVQQAPAESPQSGPTGNAQPLGGDHD